MTSWEALKDCASPLGNTGEVGISIDGVLVPPGRETALTQWTGAPIRPSDLLVQVVPATGATAAEIEQFGLRDGYLRAHIGIGRAQYEAEIDLRGPTTFALAASSLRLSMVRGGQGTGAARVAVAIVPGRGATGGGCQARRTRSVVVAPTATESIAVPPFSEYVTIAPQQVATGLSLITAACVDAQGQPITQCELTGGTAAPVPFDLPAGTRAIEVSHDDINGPVTIVATFGLGIG